MEKELAWDLFVMCSRAKKELLKFYFKRNARGDKWKFSPMHHQRKTLNRLPIWLWYKQFRIFSHLFLLNIFLLKYTDLLEEHGAA